jgi:hypothetical protein
MPFRRIDCQDRGSETDLASLFRPTHVRHTDAAKSPVNIFSQR